MHAHHCHHQPLQRPAPGEPGSDALAARYLKKCTDHPTSPMAIAAAAPGGSETVFDTGCGDGAAVRIAASAQSIGKVLGTDPSAAMIRFAARKAAGYQAADRMAFSHGRTEDLPAADGSIDVARTINSLHHRDDIEQGLGQVTRVPKRTGRFPTGRSVVVDDVFAHLNMGMDHMSLCSFLTSAGLETSSMSEHAQAKGRALIIIANAHAGVDQ